MGRIKDAIIKHDKDAVSKSLRDYGYSVIEHVESNIRQGYRTFRAVQHIVNDQYFYKRNNFSKEQREASLKEWHDSLANETMVDKCPATIVNDKVIANLFNTISDKGFYKYYQQKYMGEKLIKETIGAICAQKGINAPELILEISDMNAGGYATRFNELALVNDGVSALDDIKNFGYYFPFLVETLGHEIQHLHQFAEIKSFFNGEKVDTKYSLMALQYMISGLKEDRDRYKLHERIKAEVKGKPCIYNKGYFYDLMEVDARIEAFKFAAELLKNPYLNDGVRFHLECYFKGDFALNAVDRLHIKNAKIYAKQCLEQDIKLFKSRNKDIEYANKFLEEYKNLGEEIDKYFESLEAFEKEVPKIIEETLAISKECGKEYGLTHRSEGLIDDSISEFYYSTTEHIDNDFDEEPEYPPVQERDLESTFDFGESIDESNEPVEVASSIIVPKEFEQ